MKKRILPILFCILLLLTGVSAAAPAPEASVTVLFRHENSPVAGASFALYQAAEWNGTDYVLTAPFSGYSVNLSDDPDSEEWKALAATLAAYVARDGLTPLATGETDETGTLRFAGLSDGLYLVTGSPAELDEVLLFPQPMLVSVPFVREDGSKDTAVVTEPKYEARERSEETVERRALKVWKDAGKTDRPTEITVQLLCNGQVYDEQTLNEANHWAYAWQGLDASCDWQMIEKEVPEDYTVQVTRQSITFILTNTNDAPPPPPPPDKPTLPQTGLLWWPVPVLIALGAVAVCAGAFLLLRKKEGSNE